MLEIGSRSRTERELTNRIDQLTELFKLISLRLVNSCSVWDLGAISSIVDTRLKTVLCKVMRQSYRGFSIFRLYNTRYICAIWKTYL